MTLNDVLKEILDHLRATDHSIVIGWDIVQQWPVDTIVRLKQAGILKNAASAQSVTCNACEKHCFMDVLTQTNGDAASIRAFIVCDDAEMQSLIGRVHVPLERLQQWQSSVEQFARVIASLLQLNEKITVYAGQSHIRLGMLKSLKGRRWVELNTLDLTLVINQHSVQIEEVLYFENEQLVLDDARINDLLNKKPIRKGKLYTPSTDKCEARKLATQAMYKDWNDENLKLIKLFPKKNKTWRSNKISKMDIAKDRSAGTIRKILTS